MAENCFVLPSLTDAEDGLIEIAIAGGGLFVPVLLAEPVHELSPTIAKKKETACSDCIRAATGFRAAKERFGDDIEFFSV